MHRKFEPKLIAALKEGYTRQLFMKDLGAGVIVGIVALPLTIAFAIASGVGPAQGFYTAIIAGFIISALGGSRFQIGGPTGAFVVIVYGIVQEFGVGGLALATVMAGIMLVLMGVVRLGSFIKYIPYPVTQGFTSGIAVVIASTQIKPFLGLEIAEAPSEFVPKLVSCINHIGTTDLWTLAIGGFTIAILILWPRISSKVPASMIAIVVCTALVRIFDIPVATINSEFGAVAIGMPEMVVPEFSFELVKKLFPAAITIAMLGAIESLLSAVVADGMTGTRHRSDMELVAQGVANIITPFFGGIPATGAVARTATSIKNGAKTPIAGIIHTVVLLLVLLFFGSLAGMIPMSVLAGILLMVAWKMSELEMFIKMFRAPQSDIYVMLATFALTVLLDLTIAIPVGMVLAAMLFMRRMEQVCGARLVDSDEETGNEAEDPFALSRFSVPERVVVYEINGPFFFGAASKFQDDLGRANADILILRMRNVPVIDATGLFALEKIVKMARHKGQKIIISGINTQPLAAISRVGLVNQIGRQAICKNIALALEYAKSIIDEN